MSKTLVFKRNHTFIQRVSSSKLFWLFFVVLGFTYPIYKSVNRTLPPPLPVIYQAPNFNHVNEFNKPFGLKDLKGKVWIASFMFTSCPSSCPALMEKFDLIQKRVRGLGSKVALLSFTVDPDYDTPEILNKFARKRNANPNVWTFITGEAEQMEKTIVEGFKVPMGDKEEREGIVGDEKVTMLDIAHTEKFVLVDTKGQIRGYYTTDKHSINKLMIDVGLIANNPAY